MSAIKNQTIEEFLNDLASKEPAPGGGSVAALAGALSAALVAKVCRLTIGKMAYADVESEMKKILERAELLQKMFLILAEEDKIAFLKVVASGYSEASLEKAVAIPAEVERLASEAQSLAEFVAGFGNQNARSDALIAIDLASLAESGAILNIKANH